MTNHRFTGDFISVRETVVRLDHIFTHEIVRGHPRFFAIITFIHEMPSGVDRVLQLPLLQFDDLNQAIVGLSTIDAVKLYMISVGVDEDGVLFQFFHSSNSWVETVFCYPSNYPSLKFLG